MDYTTLITNEHASKPKFVALVNLLANGVGTITAQSQGLADEFDLDTAIGAQLDVVGLWIGQSRIIPNTLTIQFFGFSDNIAALPFGELSNASIGGPFWNIGDPYTSTTVLGDFLYRQFLYAKILRNQSDGTAAALEEALADIFGVPATLQDPGNLVVNVTALGSVSSIVQTIVQQYDILPRPAGVRFGSFTFTPDPPTADAWEWQHESHYDQAELYL